MRLHWIFGFALAAVAAPLQAAEIDRLQMFRSDVEDTLGPDYRVLAVCGASSGKSFFRDEMQKGWQDDAISSGRLIFTINPDGQYDLLFADASGEVKSATLDGGVVIPIRTNSPTEGFILVVAYPATGVTETFNVAPEGEEYRLVLWTSTKPTLEFPIQPPVSLNSKVSAFVARCI